MKKYAEDIYEEKRADLAKLFSLDKVTDEWHRLAKLWCCCEDENHLNCGCPAHGIKSRALSKASSLKNSSDGGRTY
jgi:hypothetical protein